MSEYFRKYIKREQYPIPPNNVKFRTTFKNTVYEALKRRNWRETDSDDFDLLWADKELLHELYDNSHF
jgi:tubulin polyglutamylase TTLL9